MLKFSNERLTIIDIVHGFHFFYSITRVYSAKYYERDENGTDIGAASLVARNLVDTALLLTRADTMDSDGYQLGPVFAPADVAILAYPAEFERFVQTEITDVFSNVDSTTYSYIGLCSCLVVILLTMIVTFMKSIRHRMIPKKVARNVVKAAIRHTWYMYGLFVDQCDWSPKLDAIRVMWLHLLLMIFVLIPGYVLNFLSTDQVAAIPAKYIDKVSYFLDTDKHMTPFVIKDLYLDRFLTTAVRGSKMYDLYQVVKNRNSFITTDLDNEDNLRDQLIDLITNQIMAQKGALLLENHWSQLMAKKIGCQVFPDKVERIHTSKELFAGGNAHTILNKQLAYALYKYICTGAVAALVLIS